MIEYFTDPVLSAPTIGSMIMCLIAAFVGTFAVLKRQSLVGEALSHACYPGVVAACLLGKVFNFGASDLLALLVPLIGAGIASLLGMICIHTLTEKYRVSSDSALCFVLASFFGVALVLLSSVQTSFPTLYREMQGYLFGQPATQTNLHLVLYTVLALFVLTSCILNYRSIKAVIFDAVYAKTIGIRSDWIHLVLVLTTVIAVVVGIRTLGVVLMSAMLIFPAVSSRLWTHSLEKVLLLACLIGMVSGFFGVVLSHEMSKRLGSAGGYISFPTGPMIVLSSALVFLISSLFLLSRGSFFGSYDGMSFGIDVRKKIF